MRTLNTEELESSACQHQMADFAGASPAGHAALAGMPPQLRAMLAQMGPAQPRARGFPAAWRDETSPDESVDWARVASAPFSWMSHRGGRPLYCEIRGLQSEKGQQLNGKRAWVYRSVDGAGKTVKMADATPTTRLSALYHADGLVSRQRARDPGPSYDVAKSSLAAKAIAIKPENLVIVPVAVPATPPSKRSLLSAFAGDVEAMNAPVDADEATGVFVFYPGLRKGASRVLEYKAALRIDLAKLGNWGSILPGNAPLTEAQLREKITQMKASGGLAPVAWDPLDGPGWPGIYTDLRSRGVAQAASEDVVECASLAEAFALWSEIEAVVGANLPGVGGLGGVTGGLQMVDGDGSSATVPGPSSSQPYITPMRARLPPHTTAETFREFCQWVVWTEGCGITCCEDCVGLGLLGTTVVERDGILTGVVIFATQGSFAPADFVGDFKGSRARWAATLDGARVAFEVGRSAYTQVDAAPLPREKSLRREMAGLYKSPCGRFTLASWWQNGSNAPDGASFEFAPPPDGATEIEDGSFSM